MIFLIVVIVSVFAVRSVDFVKSDGSSITGIRAAKELAPQGIRVNAVAPGTKLTNVNDRFEFTMPDYSVIVSAEFVPETFTINWYDFYNNLIDLMLILSLFAMLFGVLDKFNKGYSIYQLWCYQP